MHAGRVSRGQVVLGSKNFCRGVDLAKRGLARGLSRVAKTPLREEVVTTDGSVGWTMVAGFPFRSADDSLSPSRPPEGRGRRKEMPEPLSNILRPRSSHEPRQNRPIFA